MMHETINMPTTVETFMRGIYECHRYTAEVGGGVLEIIIRVEMNDVTDPKSMMRQWVKRGWLAKPFERTLSAETCFTDGEGNKSAVFNPTWKSGPCGAEIDFEWMLEATPENEARIVAEAFRLAEAGERK